MRFANYSRKSVYSDKSDSVQNQARMCREYCDARFPGQVESWVEYSDEDYTGANTDRPDLQQMMADVRDGLIDVLVVYQLDRLSRSVRDFSNIYDELVRHNVQFLSIKENIDVGTPVGRAMMNITATFAQMERETIAARVTDNMYGLAQKGYWLGGRPPVGYTVGPIEVGGRKHHVLVPDPEGAEYVNWIYDEFNHAHRSLQKMETDFRRRGIRTPGGTFFSSSRLHALITSPFCTQATPDVYDFYAAKGCRMVDIRDAWTGDRGVMVYGRRTKHTGHYTISPPDKWAVQAGIHEPIVSAGKWLEAQAILRQNKAIRTAYRYPPQLLKGIVRCKCGRLMLVAHRRLKSGGYSAWYTCVKRMHQGKEACDMGAVKCHVLDDKVLEIFRSIALDRTQIDKYVNVDDAQSKPLRDYKAEISRSEAQIEHLTASLAFAADSPAAKYIIAQIETEDARLQELRQAQAGQDAERRRNREVQKTISQKADEIEEMIAHLDDFDAEELNLLARKIIRECVWDGETLFLRL